jgi:uracil-DNA glycosylase
MPAPALLPDVLAPLSRRNAIELTHHRFAYDAEKLISAIKTYASANPLNKPRADSETLQRKTEALKAVRLDLVGAAESPLYRFRVDNRSFPVLGEGSADANILFIGEAPGKNEAARGKPFCGPSGDVLDEMLRGINLKREDVFLTNVLLDRPTEKRDPLPEEIAFYEPFVDRMVDIVQPGVIATLGRFAMEYIFKRLDLPEKRGKISVMHGKLVKALMPYGEIHVLPLYHPAVVLYSASQKETLRKDFEKLKLFI